MQKFVISLMILLSPMACRKRTAIPLEPWAPWTEQDEDQTVDDDEVETRDVEILTSTTMAPATKPQDQPAPADPAKAPTSQQLRFAHAENLCLEAMADGKAQLQICSNLKATQKFLAAPSLDGRLQWQNLQNKLCLASGGDRFTGFVVNLEPCAAKASQFFTRVVDDKLYALRQDAENRCLYAENGEQDPGGRVVMFPCANDKAQRLIPLGN